MPQDSAEAAAATMALPAEATDGRQPAAPSEVTRPPPLRLDDGTGLENMQQLIQLRWMAVFGQVATILVVRFGVGIRLPLAQMMAVLAFLATFNLASQLHWRVRREVSNAELFVALLVDVASLTAQLFLSGGASNPFVFLYLLQVIIGAVLLEAWSTWTMVALTTACFAALTIFSVPLTLPVGERHGLPGPYVAGVLICFALIAALLVVFITRIGSNLRARDARLADLRQRASEEEHIVRMGLLASGAAHDLGTPLATLSVILGDWRRLPHFSSDPELLNEIDEMQVQVQRCKTILSSILLSAGEARGESSVATTVRRFVDDLVEEWCATRPQFEFDYDNRFGQDLPMVSDSALKQAVFNLLDNALEASPHWVRLDAAHLGDTLQITVSDAGPGFTPEVLASYGRPYVSTKGRPGGGLGLFLVVSVARTLGGSLRVHNRPEGGATVTLSLPLAAIRLEEREVDEHHGG